MNSTACSPKIIIPDLYNRSSAVDPSFYNQPQVGKPTWGYDYTTVLRRLPRPSSTNHRIAPSARCEKTAEERFHTLARGWLAYPVTPTHHPSTAEERLYMSSLGLHSLVAERRHSSVTRYAKRSVACRDSPRHQTLRAGGTPLPRHPSDCASPSSAITHRIAPTAQYTAIGRNRRRAV